MPCMGPGENEEGAQRAYDEILKLLKDKYHILMPGEYVHGIFKEKLDKHHNRLKKAVFKVFQYDSYEGF